MLKRGTIVSTTVALNHFYSDPCSSPYKGMITDSDTNDRGMKIVLVICLGRCRHSRWMLCDHIQGYESYVSCKEKIRDRLPHIFCPE